MSRFGDLWVAFRNKVEDDAMVIFTALEPAAKQALVGAVEAGVAASVSKDGTAGDKFVAARNAVESHLAASGTSIGADALHAVVNLVVTPQAAQSSTP